jgi:hypothetical protein
MTYLDVSPMITSLRTMPEDFEIKEGWLHHIPSRHDFMFDQQGHVQIRAQCNCSFLSVKHEQSQQLFADYREWQTTYWRPLLINREFASHFRRSAFRQMLIDLAAWLQRRLMQQRHHDYRQDELEAMYPAE